MRWLKLRPVVVVASIGCGPVGAGSGPNPDADIGSARAHDAAMETTCEKIDLLFVIDDSSSMSQEQSSLAKNFPRFIEAIDALQASDGSPVDYRVAVTTTGRDVNYVLNGSAFPVSIMEHGNNGKLLQKPECGMTRPWLERADPDLTESFSCLANVGTKGPILEMPLLCLEMALSDRVADGANADFLRDDALLAIVVLTDEDDCSRTDDGFMTETAKCDPIPPEAEPVSRFLGVLDRVKKERGRWAAAVIAGPGPGACTSDFGAAFEAVRLKDFVQQGGEQTVLGSICLGDLAPALEAALAKFDAACRSFPPIE